MAEERCTNRIYGTGGGFGGHRCGRPVSDDPEKVQKNYNGSPTRDGHGNLMRLCNVCYGAQERGRKKTQESDRKRNARWSAEMHQHRALRYIKEHQPDVWAAALKATEKEK